MMILIRWMKNANETLVDLVLGCLVYSTLLEVIGVIIMARKLHFSLGVILGTVVAVGCAMNMASGIEKILDMDEATARRMGVSYSILRTIVMLVVALLAIKISQTCFVATMLAMMGLKISAHIHAYTNVYITKKIRKKGR